MKDNNSLLFVPIFGITNEIYQFIKPQNKNIWKFIRCEILKCQLRERLLYIYENRVGVETSFLWAMFCILPINWGSYTSFAVSDFFPVIVGPPFCRGWGPELKPPISPIIKTLIYMMLSFLKHYSSALFVIFHMELAHWIKHKRE